MVAAALGPIVAWDSALINGAAPDKDDAALHTLSYVQYFGWAGMGIGLAAAFIALDWLGCATQCSRGDRDPDRGVRFPEALGTAGIPPGGLVN